MVGDTAMGIATGLVKLTFRIAWFLCIGWLLGALYLLPALVMSPFRTVYGGGDHFETAGRIATFKIG